ncbi:hypothetical protein [Vibrio splendidus]|uniref:hypothetical protein n=1 Tax=Vibrio splendidus TaxID=29497 RepID=UPI000D368EFA|nr:hypothetical protein [Vibrio splendidus]PTP90244.1 hypothetical protein CWO03_05810 [Vibrio splendidus]
MVNNKQVVNPKVINQKIDNLTKPTTSTQNQSSRLAWLSKLKPTHLLLMLTAGNLIWGISDKHSFFDFWLSSDQHAYVEFKQGNYAQSAALFDDPTWKAYSRYLSGDFLGAIDLLSPQKSEQGGEPTTLTDFAKLIVANSYAHTAQFDKATALYNELLNNEKYSEQATNNLAVVEAAIEKIKNTPPTKQDSEKVIDDRKLVDDEPKEGSQKELVISDQIWLKQVRQNPSKFLRQKFQQEYSNEQN